MNRLVIALFTTMLASCGGDDSDSINLSKVEASILEHKAIWEASDLSDYSFTYRRSPGDCPNADELPAVEINVEDNKVISVYYAGTSNLLAGYYAPTIDEVFDFLLASIDSNPRQFSATKDDDALPLFDADLGYPISFFIDESSNDCDAIYNRITEFS